MLQVTPLVLDKLSDEERALYKSFSHKEGKLYLKYGEDLGEYLAYGAIWNGQPIGFAVVGVNGFLKTAELDEFYIEESWREKGIGQQFFQEVESDLRKKEFVVFVVRYETRSPTADAFTKILDHQGYHQPKIMLQRYHFNCRHFNPPWLYWKYPIPKGYEIFPWAELTEEEERELRSVIKAWGIPDEISPFDDPPIPIEYACSFGLRTPKGVLGWAVINRVAVDTVRYSSLYVDPTLRFGTSSIALLCRAIIAQKATMRPYAYFEINPEQIKIGWVHFVEKRLSPYAIGFSRVVMRWKKLNS